NPDGTMNENAGFLKGLKVDEAREKIAKKLADEGLVVKVEELEHEIPVCWRCKTPVEFIHMKEYFLKQLEFKDEVLKVADKMIFRPKEHKIRLETWIKSLAMDWPISRTRFYGTEIPVWRCSKCGHVILAEPGKYVRPWRDPPPVDKCPNCGAPKEEIIGETRTFDTWFDSSISVLYITGWLDDREASLRALEHSLRPQGYDIIRTWLYYTILRVWLLTGKPPFRWVRITGMGLDEKGRAMHKSLGNIIYPMPYIEKYGADAFRYWAAASGRLGSDYRWSENLVKTGQLFATKLINIARFISSFRNYGEDFKLREIDKAMIKYATKVAAEIAKSYEELDVFEPIQKIYDLAWNVFASNYLETVKPRAYGKYGFSEAEVRGAHYTLHRVFKLILKLLAPIMPFVTDYIWRHLYSPGKSIHTEVLTTEDLKYEEGNEDLVKLLIKVNSAVWKYKKENNMKLSDELPAVLYIPAEGGAIAEDIKALHKVSKVIAGTPDEWDVALADGIYLKLLSKSS
ncbi:MAG: valine--tRNA ligase, partial [Thermoprotei archaeon]